MAKREPSKPSKPIMKREYPPPQPERGRPVSDIKFGKRMPDTEGIMRVVKERKRQIDVERFDARHDDGEHEQGVLLDAAKCYADETLTARTPPPPDWPFEDDAWKPSDSYVRNLEKAGALIIAELDMELRRARRNGETV